MDPYYQPVEMFVRVNPILEKSSSSKRSMDVTIYNLLDPAPDNDLQIYSAEHISFGAYHAGVVCHDMSTPGDLVHLPQGQRDILMQLKKHLIKMWHHLENNDEKTVMYLR